MHVVGPDDPAGAGQRHRRHGDRDDAAAPAARLPQRVPGPGERAAAVPGMAALYAEIVAPPIRTSSSSTSRPAPGTPPAAQRLPGPARLPAEGRCCSPTGGRRPTGGSGRGRTTSAPSWRRLFEELPQLPWLLVGRRRPARPHAVRRGGRGAHPEKVLGRRDPAAQPRPSRWPGTATPGRATKRPRPEPADRCRSPARTGPPWCRSSGSAGCSGDVRQAVCPWWCASRSLLSRMPAAIMPAPSTQVQDVVGAVDGDEVRLAAVA